MSEQERLQALWEYELLDSLPEKEFDDIVELASVFFHTPISLISLLDSHRQWFKAKIGLKPQETPIEYAFCNYAIKQPDKIMIVADSFKDERFKNNPLATGEPHIRFYAGAPLVTVDGYPLGTLCVIDNHPRDFSDEQERVLKILAKKVVERIDLRKKTLIAKRQIEITNTKLELTLKRLLEAEHIAQIGNWNIAIDNGDLYWSPEMYTLFCIKENGPTAINIENWKRLIYNEDIGQFNTLFEAKRGHKDLCIAEFRVIGENDEIIWLAGRSVLMHNALGNLYIKGTVMNITERKKAEKNQEHYIVTLEETLFALSHKVRRPVANILGMVSELNKIELKDEELKEYIPYLKNAALELDEYIHELNNFIHRKKIHISKNKGNIDYQDSVII